MVYCVYIDNYVKMIWYNCCVRNAVFGTKDVSASKCLDSGVFSELNFVNLHFIIDFCLIKPVLCGKKSLVVDLFDRVNGCVCFDNYKFFVLLVAYSCFYSFFITVTLLQYFIMVLSVSAHCIYVSCWLLCNMHDCVQLRAVFLLLLIECKPFSNA